MLVFAAHARETPPPAPTDAPAVPAEAAPTPGPTPEPMTIARQVQDIRETWSAEGLLLRRLTLQGDRLVREEAWIYEGGRPVKLVTVEGGPPREETWAYDTDGNEILHVTGTTRVASTWAEGRLQSRTVTTLAGSEATTYTYGPAGAAVLVETRTAAGELLARTQADRPAPPVEVPFQVGLHAGIGTLSDVRSTSLTAGFTVGRHPTPSQYEEDPLEVGAYASWQRTSSQGVLTNDQLRAGTNLDYNNLVGRLTAFLFLATERNPVANLDVDLLAAPLGLKLDAVPEGLVTFDASFAPVWNYRSIAVAAGGECDGVTLSEDGHCASSRFRGSLRLRAAVGNDVVKLKEVVEYLPTLNDEGGILVGLTDGAIFRNTATLTIQASDHLSVSASVLYVRDLLLADQADCVADPENLLCSGQSLQSTTTVGLTWTL